MHSSNRYVTRYPSTGRIHKLKLGARVTLVHAPRDPRSKDLRLEGMNSQFEITALLPEEGRRFQYRVKDLATGRERVVLEDQIAQPFSEISEGSFAVKQA